MSEAALGADADLIAAEGAPLAPRRSDRTRVRRGHSSTYTPVRAEPSRARGRAPGGRGLTNRADRRRPPPLGANGGEARAQRARQGRRSRTGRSSQPGPASEFSSASAIARMKAAPAAPTVAASDQRRPKWPSATSPKTPPRARSRSSGCNDAPRAYRAPFPPEGARMVLAGQADHGRRVITVWDSREARNSFFAEPTRSGLRVGGTLLERRRAQRSSRWTRWSPVTSPGCPGRTPSPRAVIRGSAVRFGPGGAGLRRPLQTSRKCRSTSGGSRRVLKAVVAIVELVARYTRARRVRVLIVPADRVAPRFRSGCAPPSRRVDEPGAA